MADDDHMMRRMLARALRRHGCDVVEAEDGIDALDRAADCVPDVAIIDLDMPRMDGGAVVSELKSLHGPALPVLVLSGMDGPEYRIEAFNQGADDFIPKPVNLAELVKRVDAFERSRRAYIEAQIANARADRLRLFAAEAAALLAHDLNNGLAIAMSNLYYLGAEIPLEGEPQAALDATLHTLRRMSALVKNFVDVTRLEDDAITPQRQTVDVCALLAQAAAVHEPHGRRGGTIEVDVPSELFAGIDPTLIERVIHNLLSNALRYVDEGGRIKVEASRQPGLSGAALMIAVSNTGPPVPPALRLDLFEKYRTGTDGKAQHGMGLYFCKLACEAHGGTIALADCDEFATRFEIRMPL